MEHFLALDTSPSFLSNERGNRWTIGQLVKLVDFMEYSRYFQIYPSQGTQAMLTQRQRKFELFNPSQAMLEEQLDEHRQGATVQPYPVIT